MNGLILGTTGSTKPLKFPFTHIFYNYIILYRLCYRSLVYLFSGTETAYY